MMRWALTAILLVTAGLQPGAPRHVVAPTTAQNLPSYSLFLDPDPYVLTKEFALVYNSIPETTGVTDSTQGTVQYHGLFHLMYQRSSGPQSLEKLLGHAWSSDLISWTVDTAAFTVDTSSWNAAHVWSPSIVHHGAKDYMFYTGVDVHNDQRLGYASTGLLDTSNTVWDSRRVMVLQASDTRWAVPDPGTYGGQTQFRDPFVVEDPDNPGRLLMFYAAHDSVDFKLNQGGLAVGVARSEPGTVDAWQDLGYYRSTLKRTTRVGQLEGPHVFSVNGSGTGWRLMYSSAGTPPGEFGNTTIRFEMLNPGESLADTAMGHWGAPKVLKQYLNDDETVFGWSGSEEVNAGGVHYLAGFTAWGPLHTGIAIARMHWVGSDFTLESPSVTAVDEYRSAARGVRMRLADYSPRGGHVTFLLDSPLALEARLEIFDAQGRRLISLLSGKLGKGSSSVTWDLSTREGGRVRSGVYFARLSFAGGTRAVRIPLVR